MRLNVIFTIFLIGSSLNMWGQHEDDREVIRAFYDQALQHRQSYLWLEDLCAIGPRLSGSETSLQAIAWVKSVMDTCRFDAVYLQPVMVPHWERGSAEKAILYDQKGGEYPLSILAIGGSVATPGGGILAEVVEIPSLTALDELAREKIEGKIVFYNPPFDQTNISTGTSYGANVGIRAKWGG
ncbi:MAG: hypothetical protein IPL46_31330 [Saprospiraceae bacterium]|nr:hypothetical protein [Saprospiraceae bacterium]